VATVFPLSSPNEAILVEKYRETTRGHLKHLPALFQSLTGLRCHVLWSFTQPQRWDEQDLPSHSPLCRCLTKRNPGTLSRCRKCARQHLALALKSGHAGHPFTCFLGVHNYWLPVIVRRNTVGLAYVQTLDPKAASPCLRKDSPAAPRSRTSRMSNTPAGRACRSVKPMSRGEFKRAAQLLQLIFGHAESLTISELRKSDLLKTQGALQELQTVATHLRDDLNSLMPSLNKNPPDLQPLNRPERIAQNALDYIHRHYHQPITLQQCAKTLGLSTSYLSNLFSHRVGLPFKSYLTEIRLEKARELLSDPAMNISQVAAAVGYVSVNRFRIAFKRATGVSPKAWREMLRTRPQPLSP